MVHFSNGSAPGRNVDGSMPYANKSVGKIMKIIDKTRRGMADPLSAIFPAKGLKRI